MSQTVRRLRKLVERRARLSHLPEVLWRIEMIIELLLSLGSRIATAAVVSPGFKILVVLFLGLGVFDCTCYLPHTRF